jgi:hypothetical protein
MIPVENRIVILHLRLGIASFAHQKMFDIIRLFDIANNPRLVAANELVIEGQQEVMRLQEIVRKAKESLLPPSSSSRSSVGRPSVNAFHAAGVRSQTLSQSVESTRSQISEKSKKKRGRYEHQYNEDLQRSIEKLEKQLAVQEANLRAANVALEEAKVAHMAHFPGAVVQDPSGFTTDEVADCLASLQRINDNAVAHNFAQSTLNRANDEWITAQEGLKRATAAFEVQLVVEKKSGNLDGEVMHSVERILRKHGITSAIWFGGNNTLQGRSTYNLFRKAQKYMGEITEMLYQRQPAADAKPEEKAVYDKNIKAWNAMCPIFIRLMDDADTIFKITESVVLMSEQARHDLLEAKDKFLVSWKELNWPITPKCHFTTVHLAEEAIRTQVYGIFSESAVERMHFMCNLYRKRSHNAATPEERELRQYRLLATLSNPEISERVNTFRGLATRMKRASPEDYQKSALVHIEKKPEPSFLGKRSFISL